MASRAEGQVQVQDEVAGRRFGTVAAVLAVAAAGVVALAVATSPMAERLQGVTLLSWATAAAILAAGIALVGVVQLSGEGYLASLWVFAPLAPALAAGASVVAYVLAGESPTNPGVPANPSDAVAIGLGSTLLVWSLSAFPGATLASRKRAQMRIYDQLMQRCGVLESRVTAEQAKTIEAEYAKKALAEACCRLDAVKSELHSKAHAGPELQWVLASGYTGIRRELHRVEEALYSVQSEAALVGDVFHDDLSLEGSGIRNEAVLRQTIRDALRVLSPGAHHVLLRPVHALPPGSATPTGIASDGTAGEGGLTKGEAREALREVRFAINDYRDDIMDRFALGRNKLIWTFLAVALTTYALLGLGLLLGVPKIVVVSVSALYLVASTVGLFNRLRIESTRSSTVEDYGLYLARLVTGALLSGLAGVAGVYLIAQAPAFLSPLTADSTATPAPLDIAAIYDLTKNQLALLVAAAFGIAPGALTAQLQQQVDRLERDLQRSEPATNPATGGATSSEGGAG
jgi:hypothetical protein